MMIKKNRQGYYLLKERRMQKRMKINLLKRAVYLDLRHQKSAGLCASFVKNPSIKVLIPSCVSSFDACQTIISAAEARGDTGLLTNIRGLDLIAAEAKYHSACRARYVSKSNLKHQVFKDGNPNEECIYDK